MVYSSDNIGGTGAYNECSPLSNKFNVPKLLPVPSYPGFGLDLNYPFDFNLGLDNLGIPENIMAFINKLKFKFPGGGQLQKIIHSLQESISSIIAYLLSFLNIFLGFYYFILAIIEFILCIVNVICGLPHPFSTIRRVKRLIRKCIPLFIEICFPFFVFLALLMALLAIILALIEYIIALIKKLIAQILKNIKRLKYIIQQGNSTAALAIVSKISDLLCLFEHVFILLGCIDTIIELIKTKWETILKICNTGGGPDSTTESCCESICANFLTEPETKIDDPLEIYKSRVKGNDGYIFYTCPVYGNASLTPALTTELRSEAVYLQDDHLEETLKFKNIISSPGIDGIMFPFFPSSPVTTTTEKRKIPYTTDVSLYYNPQDGLGYRKIKVLDCIVINVVVQAPLAVLYGAVLQTNNANGFLVLDGGTFTDNLGVTRTITEVLRDKSIVKVKTDGNALSSESDDIEYQIKINYDALGDYLLITTDCMPSMKIEFNHLNISLGKFINFSIASMVTPPDVAGAVERLDKAFTGYKSNITEESTVELETALNKIMTDLQTETNNSYGQLLVASVDAYSTTKSLTPDIQFVTDKIVISVTPKSVDNLSLQNLVGSFGTNDTINSALASKFTAKPSLGFVSDFTYDGYGNFTADLTTNTAGDGTVDIYFNNIPISTVISPDNLSLPPSIDSSPLLYTFIGFSDSNSDGYGATPVSRRDETDTSNSRS